MPPIGAYCFLLKTPLCLDFDTPIFYFADQSLGERVVRLLHQKYQLIDGVSFALLKIEDMDQDSWVLLDETISSLSYEVIANAPLRGNRYDNDPVDPADFEPGSPERYNAASQHLVDLLRRHSSSSAANDSPTQLGALLQPRPQPPDAHQPTTPRSITNGAPSTPSLSDFDPLRVQRVRAALDSARNGLQPGQAVKRGTVLKASRIRRQDAIAILTLLDAEEAKARKNTNGSGNDAGTTGTTPEPTEPRRNRS